MTHTLRIQRLAHAQDLPLGTHREDHLVLTAQGTLVYTRDPVDYVYRPSIDALFESVVKTKASMKTSIRDILFRTTIFLLTKISRKPPCETRTTISWATARNASKPARGTTWPNPWTRNKCSPRCGPGWPNERT